MLTFHCDATEGTVWYTSSVQNREEFFGGGGHVTDCHAGQHPGSLLQLCISPSYFFGGGLIFPDPCPLFRTLYTRHGAIKGALLFIVIGTAVIALDAQLETCSRQSILQVLWQNLATVMRSARRSVTRAVTHTGGKNNRTLQWTIFYGCRSCTRQMVRRLIYSYLFKINVTKGG